MTQIFSRGQYKLIRNSYFGMVMFLILGVVAIFAFLLSSVVRLFALNFLKFFRNAIFKSLAESEQFYEGLLVYRAILKIFHHACLHACVSFDFLNFVRKKCYKKLLVESEPILRRSVGLPRDPYHIPSCAGDVISMPLCKTLYSYDS